MSPNVRFAVVGGVVGAMMALAILMLADTREPAPPAPAPIAMTGADPLSSELARCRVAAAPDSACLRVWDQHRRRFLGQPPLLEVSAPGSEASRVDAPPSGSGRPSAPLEPMRP